MASFFHVLDFFQVGRIPFAVQSCQPDCQATVWCHWHSVVATTATITPVMLQAPPTQQQASACRHGVKEPFAPCLHGIPFEQGLPKGGSCEPQRRRRHFLSLSLGQFGRRILHLLPKFHLMREIFGMFGPSLCFSCIFWSFAVDHSGRKNMEGATVRRSMGGSGSEM